MHLVRSERRRPRSRAASLACSLALLAFGIAALVPTAASAETRSFVNTEGFGPSQEAGAFGPATHYPGTVNVAGVPGTVTKVSVTTIDLFANFDLDMALVGPNGAQVMLMSDACSAQAADEETWTFEDAAPVFIPQGTCAARQTTSVRPSNYGPFDENDDNFSAGGPKEPFTTSLGVFNGISPNGAWKLFLIDDAQGLVGFGMTGFILNLEVEPPPPVTPPAPVLPAPTIITVPAPAPVAAKPAKTGKRAAALAKCAKKKTAKARKACRAKARKLPA